MNLNLENKVVAIAGGAGLEGSIGMTMAMTLAAEGAIPAIVDRSTRGIQYASVLKQQGCDALFVHADLTNPSQAEHAVNEIVSKYQRIDALINNVGVNDGVGLSASYEEFIASLHQNLGCYFLMTKYCLPYLKKSVGSILNIGSKVALTGQGNTSGYAAAKGGVLALTREWAVELLDDGIRVNAIVISECGTPAYDEWIATLKNGEERLKSITRNIPLGNRMTTPEEIASTAVFVLSDKSTHTTGQFIFVDGGYVHLDRALGGKT